MYRGTPFDWVDGVGFALTAAYLAFLGWSAVPPVLFERMIAAQAWGRWRDAQRMRRWLLRLPGPAPLAEHMHDYHEARALVGLEHLAEAEALYRRHEHSASVPRVLFLGLMAGILLGAKQRERALALTRKITVLGPESAMAWAELALLCARYRMGREEALHAIKEAQRRECTPMVSAVLSLCDGILALDAGDAAAAIAHFDIAAHHLDEAGDSMILEPMKAEIRAYAGVGAIRVGRRREGERLWRGALPLIQGHGSDEAILRFSEAVSGRPAGRQPIRAASTRGTPGVATARAGRELTR